MTIRSTAPAALAAALALALTAPAAAATRATDPTLWPEPQRAFLQDGPGLLLTAVQRAELTALGDEARAAWIAGFLGQDPDPATPLNELAEGIERRRQLAAADFLSPLDVRARLVFLNGAPAERRVIECGLTLKPLELWSYPGRPGGPGAGRPQQLVVYRPSHDQPWRLWLPLESKRVLYTSEMEFWLVQAELMSGRPGGGPRFDRETCKEVELLDAATGVRALRGYQRERPTQADLERFLAPPEDLAEWARAAAASPLPEPPSRLAVERVEVVFPEVRGQRTVARAYLTLAPGSGVELATEGGERELQMAVDGVVEHGGEIFEDFRVRFRQLRPDETTPIVLAVERPLRPERAYVLRLAVSDEVAGARTVVTAGFAVPREAEPVTLPALSDVIEGLNAELPRRSIAGADSLLLVPPAGEVILGLWRAEALVTGERIARVSFLVDGEPQLTVGRRPFSVEVRLAEVPKEQVVRAEGYDAAGELVAADEVVINQPRGAFAVSIVEPARGFTGSGPVTVRAEVVVPEDRRVAQVEFRLDDRPVAVLERAPWTATIEVPPPVADAVTYVTAVARLDDGRTVETVRFLNAPALLEQVDVNLVELYTTVVDRSGRPVAGLAVDDFEVYEDGRRQEIVRFEQFEGGDVAGGAGLEQDLARMPLTVGVAIDTSGSMVETLGEAQLAGKAFIDRILRPGDRCFVLGFADRPKLLMPPTDDAAACTAGLEDLVPWGFTTLHDAIVTSLYAFRGFRGQRALVVLSDGDDTASSVTYPAAIEFAHRSGVAIYAVGIGVGGPLSGVRGKLKELAEDTGGRVFFIRRAEELESVYDEIERELRSRYLIAYYSDRPEGEGEFREVEVELKPRGLEARTIRGYYQ